MDKKIDLDEKTNNINTSIKLNHNSKSTITLNKRISLNAPIVNKTNNSQIKNKITTKRKVVTTTQSNLPTGNYEDELAEELDDEEDENAEENDSEDDDLENQNDTEDDDDQNNDNQEEEKQENKQEKKEQRQQQNKKDYKSELKDRAQKKAKQRAQNQAKKNAAKQAATKTATEAAAKKAATKTATKGTAKVVARVIGTILNIMAPILFWVLIIVIIILIILLIVAVIITAIGYKYEGSAIVQSYGTECSSVTVVNTDCLIGATGCTNKYDDEVDFEMYIAGIIAANDNSANNKEYFKVSAIRNRTYVQKNITPDCKVEGNSKFKEYIDVEDSNNKELIKAAVEETENMVLIKNEELADIDDTEKKFNRETALKLITDSYYSYDEVINYFYGNNVQIIENETLLIGNGDEGLVNPLKEIYCTSAFGKRTNNKNDEEYHTGLDMGGVPEGEPIFAAADGKVTAVEKNVTKSRDENGGSGNYIIIEHEEGISTLYAHMKYGSIKDSIKVGYIVKKGERIGQVGDTGRATGVHLHYEVRKNSAAVDPTDYMNLSNAKNIEMCINKDNE